MLGPVLESYLAVAAMRALLHCLVMLRKVYYFGCYSNNQILLWFLCMLVLF